jgi:LPXTG-site transpeptidase (sortase) family protein
MLQKGQTMRPPQIQLPKKRNYFQIAGIALVAVSVIFLLYNFFPAIWVELKYEFSPQKNHTVETRAEEENPDAESQTGDSGIIVPVNEQFGIIIPKIFVNSKVFPDIDPENSAVYQRVLTKGVAHVLGTAHPGQPGNVFIFAHSGKDFYQVERYNAVFYLLTKLQKGDEIFIFYQGKKITYSVSDEKVINAAEVGYLNDIPGKNTLTLMTCWPAGTTWKRFIVVAEER